MTNDVIMAKIEGYDFRFDRIKYVLVFAVSDDEENPVFVEVSEVVFNAYSAGDKVDVNEVDGEIL